MTFPYRKFVPSYRDVLLTQPPICCVCKSKKHDKCDKKSDINTTLRGCHCVLF